MNIPRRLAWATTAAIIVAAALLSAQQGTLTPAEQQRRKDLEAKAPGLDWTAFLEAVGLAKEKELVLWQPTAVTGISALVAKEPLDVWQDCLAYHAIARPQNATGVVSDCKCVGAPMARIGVAVAVNCRTISVHCPVAALRA